MSITRKIYKTLLGIQAAYYFITAVWAIIDIDSFMKVSGPKTDVWLVKTVSVILLAMCIGFFAALIQDSINLPVLLLALSAAVGFAFIDFYYTANDTIKWVYAVDGAVQFLFIIGYVVLIVKRKSWS